MLKRALMIRCLAVSATLLTLSTATPAAADDESDCLAGDGPDIRLQGCTNLIDANSQTGDDLAVIYTNRGNAHRDKGDFDKAVVDFDRAIQINPNFTTAYYNRGLAYRVTGNVDAAIADDDKAIEIKPDFAIAYYVRANAYYDKGEFDRAIADCDKATKINPNIAC